MKVIQVVPDIAHESSGVSSTILSMCRGLFNAKCDVELYSNGLPKGMSFPYMAVECAAKKFPAARLGRSPEMYARLKVACKTADVIHNNSLWMMPNVYPYWAAKGMPIKVVTSPHGTMNRWALKRGRLQKTIFGVLQFPALRRTDMFHATCEKEYNEIRALGYKQPIAIVPIGIDIPNVADTKKISRGGLKKVVFFGRLHKVKAIDNLVNAWGLVAERFEDWELVIVGPDCGARVELEGLVESNKIPRVRFVGELNGQKKYDFLVAADLCVLPSHTENFGITVAEALACGTPVIASQGTPWKGLAENGCGWWIPIGVEPLAKQLQESLAMDVSELLAMGGRGREWMRRDFDWNAMGRKMKVAYEWLLGLGDRPEWIRES